MADAMIKAQVKDFLRGAETTEISVRLGNDSASYFEGSACYRSGLAVALLLWTPCNPKVAQEDTMTRNARAVSVSLALFGLLSLHVAAGSANETCRGVGLEQRP